MNEQTKKARPRLGWGLESAPFWPLALPVKELPQTGFSLNGERGMSKLVVQPEAARAEAALKVLQAGTTHDVGVDALSG
jgi:hypothetical protein